MSGTVELRECIWLMWHGAATDQWNPRLIMPLILRFFLQESQTTVVQRCALDSTVVLSDVYREGRGTDINSFTCNGRICLRLDNRTWRRLGALKRLNYLTTWLVGCHEDGSFTPVGLCQSRKRVKSLQACKF